MPHGLAVGSFTFVLPLLVILFLVYFGLSAKKIQVWKDKEKKWMRLAIGLVMIALGIVLILWTQGIIGISLS